MKKTLIAYYSLATGNRVKEAYGKRNPEKVLTLELNPNFLRGKDVVIDADGMPANLTAAKLAEAMLETHQAKLKARRADYAAKKLAGEGFGKKRKRGRCNNGEVNEKTAALVGGIEKKDRPVSMPLKEKRVAKKVSKIKRSAVDGKFVSAEFAKKNPDTTYARPRKSKRAAKKAAE